MEEHEDTIIDKFDEETSEAPDASYQIVEKNLQIVPRQNKTKEKNPQMCMKESNGKRNQQLVG